MGRFVARLAAWLLSHAVLDKESRNLLTSAMLNSLHALPLTDIIYTDERENLVINGRVAEMEDMRRLRETARSVLNNPAFKLIQEQVRYEAMIAAANKAVVIEDLTFYRAALWWGQQEDRYLKIFAQRLEEPDLL